MLDIIKVPLPKKKIVKEKRKGKIYVFYVLKTFRNDRNQPTNKRVSIGRLDEETNMLIPNDTFFKYFECKINIEFVGEKNDI